MPKVSAMTSITTIAGTDLLYIVKDNGGGEWVSRQIAWSDLVADMKTEIGVFVDEVTGLVPAPAAAGADAAKFLKGDATWVELSSANLSDHSISTPTQYDFIRVDGSSEIYNVAPPSPAYTPDDESSAYTGIDNAQGGTPYAQETDLNNLRIAVENLRALVEALHTWITTAV